MNSGTNGGRGWNGFRFRSSIRPVFGGEISTKIGAGVRPRDGLKGQMGGEHEQSSMNRPGRALLAATGSIVNRH